MESRRNGPQLSSRHDDDDDDVTKTRAIIGQNIVKKWTDIISLLLSDE